MTGDWTDMTLVLDRVKTSQTGWVYITSQVPQPVGEVWLFGLYLVYYNGTNPLQELLTKLINLEFVHGVHSNEWQWEMKLRCRSYNQMLLAINLPI